MVWLDFYCHGASGNHIHKLSIKLKMKNKLFRFESLVAFRSHGKLLSIKQITKITFLLICCLALLRCTEVDEIFPCEVPGGNCGENFVELDLDPIGFPKMDRDTTDVIIENDVIPLFENTIDSDSESKIDKGKSFLGKASKKFTQKEWKENSSSQQNKYEVIENDVIP